MNIVSRIADNSWALTVPWLMPGTRIYVAISSYHEKDIVKNAKFMWNCDKKVWWTNEASNAAKISEWADVSCKTELDAVRRQNFASTLASMATNADIEIPHPEGIDYFPFQRAGISYCINGVRKNALIGDDMGLGKTVQAIGVINAIPEIKKVLIIVPASLKINWYRECKKWLVRPLKIGIGDSKILPLPDDGFDVVIINYDVLTKHPKIKDVKWDLFIADECFVAGSPIQTNRGVVPIEKVTVGMDVENCDGMNKVVAVSRRLAYETYEVEFYDGRKIEATGEHPVFTSNGFKVLRTISKNSILLETKIAKEIVNELPEMREGFDGSANKEWVQILRDELLGEMENDAARYKGQEKAKRNITSYGVEASPKKRKWSWPNKPRKNTFGNIARIASCVKQERARSKRVEGCAIVKSICVKHHKKGIVVYNLQVEGHPSYTVNGLLVHNCHKLKNPKTIRGKFIYGAPRNNKTGTPEIPELWAERKLFLTGTPICNRPAELFPIIEYLDPVTWKGKWAYFMSRYCNMQQTRFGCDIKGANVDRLSELQEILRRTIMVRRLKSEVLTDLPAKIRTVIEVEPDEKMKAFIVAENEAWADRNDNIEILKAEIELAKATSETKYRDSVDRLKSVMQVAFTEMAKLRHDTAVIKTPAVIDFVKELVESGNKVIVGAHHKDVMNAISVAFPGESVMLTGETSQENRQKAVDSFQADSKIMVFIGSIQAAGVGLTLTAASNVVMAELPWIPGDLTQFEDRAHRIGQKDVVNVYHLVLNGSMDSKIAKTLIDKQRIIEVALDRDIQCEPIAVTKNSAASENTSRYKIEQDAVDISADQIEIIHEALKTLAAYCDGAKSTDGMGFNKIDSHIGKSLADSFRLSSKQAALGKKILKKYARQLGQEVVDKIRGIL